jgi:uncharacterized membrane protein YdbT with pleckstrin-like domain
MRTVEPISYLRRVPLFAHLSEVNLRHVAAITRRVSYPRDTHLCTVAQPGLAFFYLLSGEAVVHAASQQGRLRPVAYLRPGSYFGATSLLLGEPHDATVVATTDVTALVVERLALAQLLQTTPGLEGQLQVPEVLRAKMGHERFSWLEPGEVVVFSGTRHWWVFVSRIFLPTLGILAASILLWLLLRFLHVQEWSAPVIVGLVVYLPVFIYMFVDWRNDYFVVTTRRVVHRELTVYQYEARHEAPLNRIQDVTINRTMIGNLLGYGDVVIETGGHTQLGPVVFDHLAKATEAKDIIFQQIYRMQAQSQTLAHDQMERELKRQLNWETPEEVHARGQARVAVQQLEPQATRRQGIGQRLHLPRLIQPLREEKGNRITWRKHWYFLLQRIWLPILLALSLVLAFVAYLWKGAPLLGPGSNLGIVLGLLVLAFFLGFWLWWVTEDWGNDTYQITDDRLVDVEKKPLFFPEQRREATLDRVQDVTLEVEGIIANIFGFGNVNIDTAGAGASSPLRMCRRPTRYSRRSCAA